MDIRGVAFTMVMDTVIANNTTGISGNVISACVSQITAYGLEVRLNLQESLIRSHPMSQVINFPLMTAQLFLQLNRIWYRNC